MCTMRTIRTELNWTEMATIRGNENSIYIKTKQMLMHEQAANTNTTEKDKLLPFISLFYEYIYKFQVFYCLLHSNDIICIAWDC